MSEENIAVDPAGTAVAPESAPVEAQVNDSSNQATEKQISDDFDDAGENTEIAGAEPGTGAQKRIKELVSQRKAAEEAKQKAERDAAYYRGVAEARTTPEPVKPVVAAVPDAPPAAPRLDDFDSFEEFERKKDEHLIATAKFQMRQELQRELAARQQVQQVEQVKTQYLKRLSEAAATDPTILEIANDRTLPINTTMAEIIHQSDVAPQMLKWANNNRQEASRIYNLPPIMAARELGMIEAQLKNAPKPSPPRRVSAAPEPIQTVTTTSPATIDEDNLPIDEYIRRKNKAQLGRY